jgi:hypothetical protein
MKQEAGMKKTKTDTVFEKTYGKKKENLLISLGCRL